jgi:type IV pilus assembly protein PilM
VYLDFEPINPHKNDLDHLDLLINVMPKSVVDSYVSCFKAAGLIPVVLELESQSITRALMKKDVSASRIIFLDMGIASTNLIIYSGSSIRFTCSLPISSLQLTDAIVKKYGIPFKDAEDLKIKYGLSGEKEGTYSAKEAITPLLEDMVSQIKKYIGFYRDYVASEYAEKGGDNIEKIVLCGGGANLKQLPEFLSKELKVYVEMGNPFINIIPPKRNKNYIPYKKALSFTTVLGLALRGAIERDIAA